MYHDMEMDDDEKLDVAQTYPGMANQKPQYPFGLRGCLEGPQLNKMGLDAKDFSDGGVMHIHALAKITHVSLPMEDGGVPRVEFQIIEILVESEDAEDKEFDDETR